MAVTGMGVTMQRAVQAVKLLTRLRTEAPELWKQVQAWAKANPAAQ